MTATLPTEVRWSLGTFARLIGSAFAFTQMNPLRDCHLRTHQILRGHNRNFARAYFLRPNNVGLPHVVARRTMCHAGTKSVRPSTAPLPEPQWGLTLIEPPVPTLSTATEEARAMGGSSKFHQLLTLSPQGVENHQQTNWQVWTLLSPVPRLTKLHRLATREEWGTQDWGSHVHQASQQRAVRPMEDRNTWGSQYLWTLSARGACCSWSNLGFATSSVPACANSKFQRSGEEH